MAIKVYGGNHGIATANVIPDNTSEALDVESTDAKDYITVNTTTGAEEVLIGGVGAGIKVGVGTDSPNADFTVRSSGTNARVFEIESPSNGTMLRVEDRDGGRAELTMYGSAGAAQHKLHTKPGADGVIFNDLGEDVDFRVESADQASMLFVDASENTLGIGGKTIITDGTASGNIGQVEGNADAFIIDSDGDTGMTICLDGNDNGYLSFVGQYVADKCGVRAVASATTVNKLVLFTNGQDRIRIDSTGQVGIGSNSPQHKFQVQDGDAAVVTNNASDATAKALVFTRSRNGTDGDATIVNDNDVLGRIDWYGADASSGTTADNQTISASIYSQVDGTPGHEDMPGSIRMATTADDAAALSDRLVIRRNGNIGLGDTEPNYRVVIGGGLSTPILYAYNSNTSGLTNGITSPPNGAAGAIFDHRATDSIYCMNTTATNAADSRSTGVAFFGRKFVDGGDDEYPMMGALRVKHEGTAVDQKGYMTFYTNAGTEDRAPTERMRIDSAGRLGVGALASDYWYMADDLVVSNGSTSGMSLVAATTGTLSFATGTSGAAAYQNVIQGTGAGSGDGMRFITAGTNNECIRLTTAGDILCPQLDASSDVQTDGSKNLTTSSDMRLKNPIMTLEAGLDKVNQLVPRFFSWKNDEENKQQLGFFSQEVHDICPEAAPKTPKMIPASSEFEDDGVNICDKETTQALDEDGNLDFNWSLNSRAIVALLVKSVQELSAKVTALEEAQGN